MLTLKVRSLKVSDLKYNLSINLTALVFNIWGGIFIAQGLASSIWMITENLQIYRLYVQLLSVAVKLAANSIDVAPFNVMKSCAVIFESIFFPDFYQKYVRILSESTFLIIKGNLNCRDGDIALIGKEAIDPVFLKKLNKYYKKEALKLNILSESVPLWKS